MLREMSVHPCILRIGGQWFHSGRSVPAECPDAGRAASPAIRARLEAIAAPELQIVEKERLTELARSGMKLVMQPRHGIHVSNAVSAR